MQQKKLTIVITVLLILAVGYIVFDKVQVARESQLVDTYRQGYQQGLSDAVVALYQQTENCQTTTINIGNETKQLFDVSCLQQTG